MLRNWQRLIAVPGLVFSGAVWAHAQTSSLEIQQLQVRQELDRQVRREADQHQDQLDDQRRIEWQSARDQRRLDNQRQAQEAAQQQYAIQKMQQQVAAKQAVPDDEQGRLRRLPEGTPAQQAVASSSQSAAVVIPHWSYSNITDRDKLWLAALGVLLITLAFPAFGILPTRHRL